MPPEGTLSASVRPPAGEGAIGLPTLNARDAVRTACRIASTSPRSSCTARSHRNGHGCPVPLQLYGSGLSGQTILLGGTGIPEADSWMGWNGA
jgi:hypothetical protein